MTRSLVFALALASATLEAQQHSLVGTWQVSFLAGMSVENGVSTPLMGTGTLTIEARGDSLIGTLTRDPIAGVSDRPPDRMTGLVSEGAVTLTSNSMATINMNGMERTAAVVSTWSLTANGDSLEGTVERRIEGLQEMAPPPSPVSGTRRKS